jgi:DNA repair protein RecN (Recombination protein N)
MLTSLSIKNFALIEKLAITFESGFSTITGETGAGKSILLGALGLILGKRADLSSLKNKDEKCVVEAIFNVSNYNLKPFFEANDLDFEAETIIRREILPSGKSRAFVNDSPINLAELQDLGSFLIDIHSQNQTHELSDESVQFKIIDALAENTIFLDQFSEILKNHKHHKSELKKLLNEQEASKKEEDYNIFLFEELEKANLANLKQSDLEQEYETLNNVESIRENLDKAMAIVNEEQLGAVVQLKEVKNAMQKLASMSAQYQEISERTNSLVIEFEDVIAELENLSEKVTQDPERLIYLSESLQNIYTLQKKHQVSTIPELLTIQENLSAKLNQIANLDLEIEKHKKAIVFLNEQLLALANQITEKRQKAIPVLNEKLCQILELLGIPNAQFKIDLTVVDQFFHNGNNQLQFLFSANKGTDFGLLKKVASGGEMSRIMLATKAILSSYSNLPTIIFDEIDTGVSGEIANKMALIMKKMSTKMQVFSITHLPQIAAKGNRQYKVFKTTANNQTSSELKLLGHEDRVFEIAEMLSGANPSESAIQHAKALLT